jgi:hypothetical protein
MIMNSVYISLFYLAGGLVPVFFWTLMKITKNRSKINVKIRTLSDLIHEKPSVQTAIGGNLDSYVQQNPNKFSLLNFWDELFLNLFQPLFILSLLALLQFRNTPTIIFTIMITLFGYAIEFHFAEEWNKEKWYRFLIIIVWVAFLGILIYSSTPAEETMPNIG